MVNFVLLGSQAPSALIDALERGQSVFEVTAISKTLQCTSGSTVFLGPIEGSDCVVKSYQKSKLTDAELCQVHQEVQLHQQLSDSPVSWAVVPFWAAADDANALHIVMQHCAQGDLRSMLGSGALSEGCVRDQVVTPLLHALQELHAKGYVHRDLKPDNVFMSSSSALLGDFSLAVGPLPGSSDAGSLPATPGCAGPYSRCSNDSTTSLTPSSSDSLQDSDTAAGSSAADCESEVGSMASLSTSRSSSLLVRNFTAGAAAAAAADGRCHAGGTPAYCAPEVVLAAFNSLPLAEALGTHNDIWSLGILVTECLLGAHPYGDVAAASGAVLHSIAGNQPLPISALRVSAQCRDWLAAALTRDPRQRWTAAQLLEHAWISAALPVGPAPEQDAAAVVLVPGQFGSRAPAGHADAWDEGWQAFSKQQQGFGTQQVQKQQAQRLQQQARHAGVSAPPPWVEDDWVTGLDRLSSQLVAAKAAAGSNDAAWTPAPCGQQATAGQQQQEQHEVRLQHQQQQQQQYAVQGITSWED